MRIVWLELEWPREVTAEHALDALRALNGLSTPSRRDQIVLEAVGREGDVRHRLGVPSQRSESVVHQVRHAIPGVSLVETGRQPVGLDRAWAMWMSTRQRPLLTGEHRSISGALLTALSSAETSERLLLQLWLGPVRRPMRVATAHRTTPLDDGAVGLLRAPFTAPADADAEARKALRDKQSQPGWRAHCRLGVQARGSRRQRQLLGRAAAALRMTQGAGVQVGFRSERVRSAVIARPPWRWSLALNLDEVASASSWPIETGESLVRRRSSRAMRAPRAVRAGERIIGESTFPGTEGPVGVSVNDSLRHTLVLGPTGVGKSTLLLNLALQDIAAGRGVVLVEPKGDLIRDVLARIPAHRSDDVVLIEPGRADRVVGLNPLDAANGSPEFVADIVLAAFHQLFRDSWGPRLADLLFAGFLTAALRPGMTLAHVPLLFSQPRLRRQATNGLRDDVALGPLWAWFESLDHGARAAALAPVLNKLRIATRPGLRVVLGQTSPRFHISDVFRHRRIVLVNLARSQIGPEAANLLGALIVGQLWQATLARTAVPAERRHPVFVYIDEWQDFTALPTDLGDALVQARSHGVGLVLANQHLGQLSPPLKAAVLANAQSRVLFRLSVDDAAALARGSGLEAEDFRDLPAYEAYAQVVADGTVLPYASIRTFPPPPSTRDPEEVAQNSLERYGVERAAVEAELRTAFRGGDDPDDPIGFRPRPTGDDR